MTILDYLIGIDHALFRAINGAGQKWADPIFHDLSSLGAWTIAIVTVAFLAPAGRRAFWRHALAMVLVALVMSKTLHLMKTTYWRSRPAAAFAQQIAAGAPEIRRVDEARLRGASFPSGHSFTAFFCMAYIGLYRRSYRPWVLLLAGAIAYSRIYVGQHFPSDCLAGAALGMLGAWLAWRIYCRFLARPDCSEAAPAATDVPPATHPSVPSESEAPSVSPTVWHVPALILISALFLLPGLLSPRGFWVADETRYAEVIREMIHDGQWAVPHLNGSFYSDKPPLYFWLCAGVSLLVGGITPAACLLISWLSAAGCVIANYRFAARLLAPRTAFVSSLLLLSMFLFMACGQIVRMDMLLALFVLLALDAFHRGLTERRPAFYFLFYLYAGLAVMSKGPLGFAFAFLPAIAFLAWQRKWHDLRVFVLHWGFPIPLLLAGAWLGAAWAAGYPDFVRSIFVDQIVGRSVKGGIQSQPPYFYVLLLPLVLLPWSPFAVRALRRALKERTPEMGLLFWWFVLGLAVISAIRGKLFIYLLPILPPAAILLADQLLRLAAAPGAAGRAFRWEGAIASILTFGTAAALPIALLFIPGAPPLEAWPLTALFLPLAIGGVLLALRGDVLRLGVLLTAGMSVLSIAVFSFLAPQVDAMCSGREIGAVMAEQREAGRTVATCGFTRGILNFYAGMRTQDVPEAKLGAFLKEEGRIVVLPEKIYRRNRDALGSDVQVLSQHFVVDRTYFVLASPPPR